MRSERKLRAPTSHTNIVAFFCCRPPLVCLFVCFLQIPEQPGQANQPLNTPPRPSHRHHTALKLARTRCWLAADVFWHKGLYARITAAQVSFRMPKSRQPTKTLTRIDKFHWNLGCRTTYIHENLKSMLIWKQLVYLTCFVVPQIITHM